MVLQERAVVRAWTSCLMSVRCAYVLQEYALKVIAETNESWAKLVRRAVPAGELSLA